MLDIVAMESNTKEFIITIEKKEVRTAMGCEFFRLKNAGLFRSISEIRRPVHLGQ
jgi:hypothetical protein